MNDNRLVTVRWRVNTNQVNDKWTKWAWTDVEDETSTSETGKQGTCTVCTVYSITPKVFLRVQEEQGAFTVRFLMRI